MVVPKDQIGIQRANPVEQGAPSLEEGSRQRFVLKRRRREFEIPLKKQVQLDFHRLAVVVGRAIEGAAGNRQRARRLGGAKGEQPIDSERVERWKRLARRRQRAEKGVAQIFDKIKAAIEVVRRHGGRAQARFDAQPAGDGEERAALAGEMRDLAIGASVADRRAVADGRPVHQHDGLGPANEPREQPRRRVAAHACAARAAPAIGVEEGARLAETHKLLLPGAEAEKRDAARIPFALDPHLKPVGGKAALDGVRPFGEHGAGLAQLAKADLLLFAGPETVEIAVIDRMARR